ncbi:uncharacterized protein LOC111900995 [Lactuca sativa]|uniref:uncharacterized protein LOC111900995 n=1 Tax=Lactuca sativa TaxID=4236 RepID=UPI000CD97D88|nr:uncharacterized protein LOC111900995 [Lactuca sativa]
MAQKPRDSSPSQSDNEDDEESASPHVSPRGNTPPRSPSPTQEVNIQTPPPSPKQSPPKPEDVKIPTPPPSPKQTTPKLTPLKQPTPTPTPKVPVLVVPISTTETSLPPPPVSFVSISTTSLSTPIITPVTTTIIPEQIARVNVSNTGAPIVSDTPVITIPPSPTKSIGSGATLVVCKKAYADVTEVIRTTQIFLDSLKGHADTNVTNIRESVASLSQYLKEEQMKFEEVRSSMKADNASLISSFSSKLDTLHADIAKEGTLKE